MATSSSLLWRYDLPKKKLGVHEVCLLAQATCTPTPVTYSDIVPVIIGYLVDATYIHLQMNSAQQHLFLKETKQLPYIGSSKYFSYLKYHLSPTTNITYHV